MSDNLLPPRSNNDKEPTQKRPAPVPSHLKPGNVEKPPVAPPQIVPSPAKVEGKYCPYCDELISVNAIKCKHCQSMLEKNSETSTSTIPKPSQTYQSRLHHRSRQKKKTDSFDIGLQFLKVIGIAAIVGVGFFVYWSLPIPMGNGFVKSADNDSYSVYVNELEIVVSVPSKNVDGSLWENDIVKIYRQQGEYYIKRHPVN